MGKKLFVARENHKGQLQVAGMTSRYLDGSTAYELVQGAKVHATGDDVIGHLLAVLVVLTGHNVEINCTKVREIKPEKGDRVLVLCKIGGSGVFRVLE